MFRDFRPLTALALIAALTATSVLAEEPVELRSRDVLLHSGSLSGVVLNRESHPLPGIQVRLLHGKQVIATATSDDNGNFAVHGLRNGGHVVATGDEKELVRFWNSGAAPPSASARLIMVVDEEVIRGQGFAECVEECGDTAATRKSCLSRALSNPTALLLLGGGAAGIVAIVAHNDNDAPASP